MTSKLKPLAEQVIVITGASSGIGLVTARTAAARGAKVMLVARGGDDLRRITGEINEAGGVAYWAEADVGDAGQVKAAAARAVERFGRIDTWVNNAGVAIYARLMDTPDDEHEQMFRTNYFGMVHGCMAAVPLLERQGGALITVASIAADMPSPVMAAYAASKHAVKAYVETLRMELGEAGAPISITLIKPAGIDTPVAQHAANHEGGEAQIPPPVYDPQLVADAILDCATCPRRELTVGGAGRAQALFAEHFKGVYEKIAPYAAKAFVDRTKTQPTPSNLFASVDAGRERSGDHAARRVSFYTAAAKHPKTMAMVGLAALIGTARLLRRSGRAATALS